MKLLVISTENQLAIRFAEYMVKELRARNWEVHELPLSETLGRAALDAAHTGTGYTDDARTEERRAGDAIVAEIRRRQMERGE